MGSTTPSGGVRLQWVGPLAFAKLHRGPPGIDLDLGQHWGPRRDQRVSWRHDPGSNTGLLYAFDPLWDEYAVLATGISREAAEAAYRLLDDPRMRGATVESFAECARWLTPTVPLPASRDPGPEL